MLKKKNEERYVGMLSKLELINGSLRDSVENLTESLAVVTDTLFEIRIEVKNNRFVSDHDEIHFFKYVKPRFLSWQIYMVDLHHMLASVPVGTDQMIRDYYMAEMTAIHRFFVRHSFYYQYYLADESAMDEDFFLCRSRKAFPPGQEQLPPDPGFSTYLDYLYGTFKALEMLRDFIIRKMRLLYQSPDSVFVSEFLSQKKRWWSGDKIDLVEIAYGIYYTHRMNGGKVDISDIVEWLEDSLQVDLGQAYRMFLDIRKRKTVSYTKFLDEMRNAIHEQIDDGHAGRSKN